MLDLNRAPALPGGSTLDVRAINACPSLVVFAYVNICCAEVTLLQDLRCATPGGSSQDTGALPLQ